MVGLTQILAKMTGLNVNTTIHRATWDVSKQDSFLLNLDNDYITQFINHMDSLDGNYTKNDVDLLTSQCASLLYNAADEQD